MAKICGIDGVMTLEDLERRAVRMAGELAARGLRPGDRVLLDADNSVRYVSTLLALMHAGASIVLADHQERAETRASFMRTAGVSWRLSDESPLPGSPAVTVSLAELRTAVAARTADDGRLDVTRWRARPDGLIMWSSGSTGIPKAIVKTGDSFLANLRRNIDLVGHRADDVLVPLLPFSHQYGLSMVLIAWLARCSLVVAPYRRPDQALRMAEHWGGTVFDATPATYRTMLQLAHRRPVLRRTLADARMLCSGAAPLDPRLVAAYREETGHVLLDSYGSTEMGNVSFATLANPVACGQPVAGVRCRIVDDAGAEAAPGQVGEIMVATPDLMAGYLGASGELEPVTDGPWYASGDFGRVDSAGNLTVLGRKRAVHRMGYTLFPDIIERRLTDAGCSVRIVALPDDRMGSQLVAFVEDERGRPPAYWRERIAGVLPAYEAPNRIVVVAEFPLNHNGKPDSRRMAELAVTG